MSKDDGSKVGKSGTVQRGPLDLSAPPIPAAPSPPTTTTFGVPSGFDRPARGAGDEPDALAPVGPGKTVAGQPPSLAATPLEPSRLEATSFEPPRFGGPPGGLPSFEAPEPPPGGRVAAPSGWDTPPPRSPGAGPGGPPRPPFGSPHGGAPGGPPYPAFGTSPVGQPDRTPMYVGAAIGLIGLLALVGGGLFFWVASSKIDDDGGAVTARSTPDRTAPAEGSVGADAPLPITADDPSWGSDTAPVTAVVFSDYDCPYCKKLEATVANLKTRYGPHKLRVVFKHFPLPSHTRARDAHIASQAVRAVEGNDAFWRFHERAFEEMGGGTGAVDLAGWAESAGLSRSDFDAARGDTRHGAKVDADIALGKRLGVNGIPATFINGISLRGAQPESKLAETIDAQLSAAETELAAGTPATQIYTTLTARNLAPAADKPAPTPAPSPPAADDTTVWKVPVLPTDPVLGPADAAVTLVAFSDFECPFCSRAANTVREIHQAYPSEVRIVWKDHALPFHKNAPAAHQLAREAQAQLGNDGFWKAHDLLFENQRALSRDQLLGYAGQLGLDRAKVADALAKNAHQGHLDTGATLAADVEASGTPHFFVNGRRIKGAVPFEKFKTVIDEEIAHAARLRAEGVSAGNLYAEIIKSGKGGPELERKEAGALGPDTPMKGAPNAPVTIHVFSDFQCPFCGRVNPTLAELLTQYDGRVRVAWRHFPLAFHKDAPLAHQAAQEAKSQRGDAGFWAMHDKLFANQKELDRVSLERYAAEIGLDVGAFRAALDSQKHRARVEAEVAAGQAAGIRGTPSFVINGYFISGAQPAAKFRSIIDRALAEAGGSSL